MWWCWEFYCGFLCRQKTAYEMRISDWSADVCSSDLSLTAVLNQLRTLVAHLWENDGQPMTVTAQFLDSVNIPPPGPAAELWAPVGLRYHALHHLMPSMPYHDLPEAHRRLVAELVHPSTYDGANHHGMLELVARIAKSTMIPRH